MTTVLGFLAVAASGLLVGAGNWPYKLMRTYQFEHWMLVGTLIGMVVVPWTVILLGCPNVFECLGNVPTADLVKSNLFSIAWGISVVLSCLCYVRIGIGLTIALSGRPWQSRWERSPRWCSRARACFTTPRPWAPRRD